MCSYNQCERDMNFICSLLLCKYEISSFSHFRTRANNIINKYSQDRTAISDVATFRYLQHDSRNNRNYPACVMAFIHLPAKVVTTDSIYSAVVSPTASGVHLEPRGSTGSHEFSKTRDLARPMPFIRVLAS